MKTEALIIEYNHFFKQKFDDSKFMFNDNGMYICQFRTLGGKVRYDGFVYNFNGDKICELSPNYY